MNIREGVSCAASGTAGSSSGCAWLGWCRRLRVRHERLLVVYRAVLHPARAMLALDRF